MTESKQAMQNTIKNLQAKSENINKLQEKGSKVIVLQFGSHTIKMGFANERVPFTVRPFVAYRRNHFKQNKSKYDDRVDYELFKAEYLAIEDHLKVEGVIAGETRTFKGKPKNKTITSVDQTNKPKEEAEVLFGEEALWVQDNPNYILKKAIKYGMLNISCEKDSSNCLSDIENLICYVLKQKLKIPQKDWTLFSCILVLPDVFIRQHIKSLINIIFTKIGFKKLYVHLESVMACFGTAVNSACVVDIGHQKISVCCVDEGVILPKTMIRKNFGVQDISKGLIKIINQKLTEDLDELRMDRQGDLNQIDKIKDIACAIRQTEQTTNKIYQMYPIRNGNKRPIQISYTDSICVIANSIFSQMWNSYPIPVETEPFDSYSELFGLREDPQDFFEEFSGGGQIYQINKDHPNYSRKIYDPFLYQSLENIIVNSLMSLRDCDVRRKFASSILIVGGGAHMHKLGEQIIARVTKKMECQNGFGQKVQMATDLSLRQIAPIYASWLGGTVIPKLDSLRDLWIEKNKYIGHISLNQNDDEEQPVFDKKLFTRKEQSQEWGIRYLKEKIPFLW